MAICGRLVIGVMLRKDITGFQARGREHLKWAICGHLVTGDIRAAGIAITTVIGARILVTTAA